MPILDLSQPPMPSKPPIQPNASLEPDRSGAANASDGLHDTGLPAPSRSPIERPLVFVGSGAGYFRIWIVNLVLTICTFGLYSAWAKVRRLRYFYGNTLLDGSPFEFHGRPIALLRGRIVAVILLLAYSVANKFSIVAWIAVAAVLVALMPWFLWKSLRFRLANTSYRGVHFGFDGTVVQAYLTFIPLILMFLVPAFFALVMNDAGARRAVGAGSRASYYFAVFAAFFLAPWFYFRLRAYQHRHARLGTAPFRFDGKVRSAYWLAFKLGLLTIGYVFVASIPFAILTLGAIGDAQVSGRPMSNPVLKVYAVSAAAYVLFLSGLSQPLAMIQNFVWSRSALDDAPFESMVSRVRLWWILFGNFALTLVTLGLFWPFAVVRSTRYRIGCVTWAGDSGAFTAAGDARNVGASGEETADLFGLDIGL